MPGRRGAELSEELSPPPRPAAACSDLRCPSRCPGTVSVWQPVAWQKLSCWEGRAFGESRHEVGTKVTGRRAVCFHPLFSVLSCGGVCAGVSRPGPSLSLSVGVWLAVSMWPSETALCRQPPPPHSFPLHLSPLYLQFHFSIFIPALCPLIVSLRSVPPSAGTCH